MDKKHKMILAGISKSIIFGLSIMFIKIAMEKISIFSLLAVRFTLAALIMIVMYLLKIIELNYKGKNIVNLIALSLLFPVLYFAFETLGLKYTASTRAAIIIALNPVVVAILSTLILKEKPNNAEIIFILISTFGVIFIALMSGNSMGRSNIIGIISLFIAVVSLAFYIIFSRMLSKEFTPTEITFSMMGIGAIVFSFFSIIEKIITKDFSLLSIEMLNIDIVFSLLYLGVFASIIGTFLNNYMLSKITASQTSIYTNFTTVITILSGIIFLNESFQWYELIGSIIIITGVWGTSHYGAKSSSKKNPSR